jgi:endonuclease YncB( thermonuclease family)
MMLLLFAASFAQDDAPAEPAVAVSSGAPPPASAVVVSVYDGDTFTLSGGDKVRLRWVNTPELKRPAETYGPEARDATKALVEGKTVKLLYGPTQRDGYGRLLAGAEVDGKNLSLALLEQGLAHLYVIPPDSTDLTPFVAAQEKARAAKRGIWSLPQYQGTLHITSFHANADGDDRANVNGEYFRLCNVSGGPLDLAGYKVTDISGGSWELPSVVVPSGNTIKVHSGKGSNQTDAAQQLAIYLDNADPIWNNKEDRLTVYDRFGKVVDTRVHRVESEGK